MTAIPTVTTTLQNTAYIVDFIDDLGHAWTADEPLEIGPTASKGRWCWMKL
jgi:putative redox protein